MTAAIAKRIGLLGGPVLARRFMCMFAVVAIAVMGTAHAAGPLRAEPESLERAAPELIERLRADPYNYFRFVNRTWQVAQITAQIVAYPRDPGPVDESEIIVRVGSKSLDQLGRRAFEGFRLGSERPRGVRRAHDRDGDHC